MFSKTSQEKDIKYFNGIQFAVINTDYSLEYKSRLVSSHTEYILRLIYMTYEMERNIEFRKRVAFRKWSKIITRNLDEPCSIAH